MPDEGEVPDASETGDESNIQITIIIALIALVGITTVVVTRRKYE